MKNNKGQALVLILILTLVMLSITTAAVVMVLANSQQTSELEMSNQALAAAESGIEDALILMLRDPYGYTNSTVDFFDGRTASTTVSASNFPKNIVSIGKYGVFTRKVTVGVVYNNNELSVSGWQETY